MGSSNLFPSKSQRIDVESMYKVVSCVIGSTCVFDENPSLSCDEEKLGHK